MSDKKLEENLKAAELLADIQREYYPEFQKEEGIPVYTGFISINPGKEKLMNGLIFEQ